MRARVASAALAVAALVGLLPLATGAATPANDNARTLVVSLPGPFNGCSVLDPGATATTGAVDDLLLPSAFQTNTNGNLVGAGGPLASAELTSLSPETVVYTIAPRQLWSNGLTFNGADLVAWWQRARSLPSVLSDGYRDIQSLTVGSNGLTVTAVFATPDADWSLLFRDVEARGTVAGCAVANLVTRPSLGAYRVVSATPSRVVLQMNRAWGSDQTRFGRVVLIDSGSIPSSASAYYASYLLTVGRLQIQALSAHPSVASHLGTSSNIEVMTFAPDRVVTRSLELREALSWSISRQTLINTLYGSITFSPGIAASSLYSQGQSAYPGGGGTTPTTPTTVITGTTTAAQHGLADCLTCALEVLADAGYHRTGASWVNAAGHRLTLEVVTGPGAIDYSTGTALARQWRAVGLGVTVIHATSDVLAAATVAQSHADVAVFAKPTQTTASVAARSWSGAPYPDTFLSGFRSSATTSLFDSAISNFNPEAGTATWLQLDQAVMKSYWVRPLFTAPSLVEWSNSLVGMSGSLSAQGFIDQVTGLNSSIVAGSQGG